MRLDVPEMLYQAFPPSLTEEREQLDQALLSWLLDTREDYASQVRRLGFPTYGKRVGDALIALQLLELPEGRRRIRRGSERMAALAAAFEAGTGTRSGARVFSLADSRPD